MMLIHVFGLPHESMDVDSRLCTEPDVGEGTVFHVHPVPVIQLGHCDYACAECGVTSAREIPLAS